MKRASIVSAALCLGLALFLPRAAQACAIPVFRYALERWFPEMYPVVVFHDGALAPKDKALVDKLDSISTSQTGANVEPAAIDISRPMDSTLQALWKAQGKPALPWMVVRFPKSSGIAASAWSGAFNEENVRMVLASPVRKEIGRRILAGESAVWVLLESGDKAKDKAARELLQTNLKKAQQTLILPPMRPEDRPGWFDESRGPKLRVAFSLLSVSRGDAREAFFANMMQNAWPDMKGTAGEPVAIPFFGMGRAPVALAGKSLTAANIKGNCSFLVGMCSCEIKEMNPGVDMLFSVDWTNLKGDRLVQDPPRPQLTGLGSMVRPENLAEQEAPKSAPAKTQPKAKAKP